MQLWHLMKDFAITAHHNESDQGSICLFNTHDMNNIHTTVTQLDFEPGNRLTALYYPFVAVQSVRDGHNGINILNAETQKLLIKLDLDFLFLASNDDLLVATDKGNMELTIVNVKDLENSDEAPKELQMKNLDIKDQFLDDYMESYRGFLLLDKHHCLFIKSGWTWEETDSFNSDTEYMPTASSNLTTFTLYDFWKTID